MKITDIRTRNICIPLSTLGKHEPVTMWYGSRFAAIKTIIFIETDEGITGLGETSIGAGGDQRLFEQIKSRLVGRDPHDINSIERGMNLTGQVTTKLGHLLDTSASSALNITGSIDQALWDIVGKAANQPIYNLIGGKYRDRVEARYWMGAKPPDKVADEVKRAVALGFKSFKIKIGLNPEFDIECVAAAREAAGPRIELGYDCNGSYSQLEAIRMLRKMEPYDPSHVEEPVDSSSVRALAEVSRHTDIPILCDGPARTTKEQILELIIQRACDAVHLDVVINGGFLENPTLRRHRRSRWSQSFLPFIAWRDRNRHRRAAPPRDRHSKLHMARRLRVHQTPAAIRRHHHRTVYLRRWRVNTTIRPGLRRRDRRRRHLTRRRALRHRTPQMAPSLRPRPHGPISPAVLLLQLPQQTPARRR